ncbi:hypothetical protein NDU88_004834 [Pleurodeles waltl]|uniref:Uncharacterized protein n=1 Tax=Pleurodeles waltl TaxID=8319 RepID=A0AAV7MWA2_PLEWA|nr:hypothetical protein NDU88_004834 [Pleurodeles waltl]
MKTKDRRPTRPASVEEDTNDEERQRREPPSNDEKEREGGTRSDRGQGSPRKLANHHVPGGARPRQISFCWCVPRGTRGNKGSVGFKALQLSTSCGFQDPQQPPIKTGEYVIQARYCNITIRAQVDGLPARGDQPP